MSFIGIDVAKTQFEFACRPGGETGVVPNDEGGIQAVWLLRCGIRAVRAAAFPTHDDG